MEGENIYSLKKSVFNTLFKRADPALVKVGGIYSLILIKMNTTPILLAYEPTKEERMLLEAAKTQNYKNKKNELKIKDRLDLWNSVLYGEQVGNTLNATKRIAAMARVQKTQTQRDLLATLLQENTLDAEHYPQAA